MASDEAPGDTDLRTEEGGTVADPLILLFMNDGRDRQLLTEALGERYRTTTSTDPEALEAGFDCCILNDKQFAQVADTIRSIRERTDPFLPFVLLVSGQSTGVPNPDVWEYADDVIELPVAKPALEARITNLIERRRTSVRLAEREVQLRATVEDLRLKERAIDEAPVGMTITGPAEDDVPIVYANEEFERLTGYPGSEIVGENCRFLQGEETAPASRAVLREAIEADRPASVDIVNYRKNGEKFWNKVDIAPLRDETGRVTHYVGFQTDITDRKLREQRLEVLNRILSHNLRNKMNVIEGHVNILKDEVDDATPPQSLEAIENAASNLASLAETVREIERVVNIPETPAEPIPLGDRLRQLVSGLRDRFPAATIELTLPEDDPCEVEIGGLVAAIEEAAENAIIHNDGSDPHLAIGVEARSDGWLDIVIEDNGPGIPEQEIEVLEKGETPLNHADRVGLWLIYWITSRAGGRLTITESDPGGTLVKMAVPGHEADRQDRHPQ